MCCKGQIPLGQALAETSVTSSPSKLPQGAALSVTAPSAQQTVDPSTGKTKIQKGVSFDVVFFVLMTFLAICQVSYE